MDTENNNKQILVMDEKDEEISDLLQKLGYGRTVSIVVACLTSEPNMTTFGLQQATNLRQPEISLAARQLKDIGWLKETEQKKSGKGRPNYLYSLIVTLPDIIRTTEDGIQKTAQETNAKVARLRQLT